MVVMLDVGSYCGAVMKIGDGKLLRLWKLEVRVAVTKKGKVCAQWKR